jgi:hypothetical protein
MKYANKLRAVAGSAVAFVHHSPVVLAALTRDGTR